MKPKTVEVTLYYPRADACDTFEVPFVEEDSDGTSTYILDGDAEPGLQITVKIPKDES